MARLARLVRKGLCEQMRSVEPRTEWQAAARPGKVSGKSSSAGGGSPERGRSVTLLEEEEEGPDTGFGE